MELVSLWCAACFAFGDPTVVIDPAGDGVTAHGLAATTFQYRSDAPRDWTGVDGLALQQGRLGISGTFNRMWGFYGALAADDRGLTNWEVYGDVMPVDGFRIRAGRWLVGLGGVSARRVEQRAFVDAPLHTERFLGPDGLFDVGLQLRYRIPVKSVPIDIEAAVLRGGGTSFGAPLALGDGGDTFEKLLYVTRLRIYPGEAFGQHLALGLTFATARNDTGPSNRTDLIGGDIEALFNLPSEVKLGWGLEYMLRRYGIPRALEVEGALSTEITVGWRTLLTGVRADIMGMPTPAPLRERVEYRISAVAGWTPTQWVRIRGQYSARNDTPNGDLAHEVTIQAIIGLATRFGVATDAPTSRYKTMKTEGLRAVTSPAMSAETSADWRATAGTEAASAQALLSAGQFSSVVLHAQRGAYARVRATLIERGVSAPGRAKSVTRALKALGLSVPATVLRAAQRLDRDYGTASAPGDLGGSPSEFFDQATAERAVQDARTIEGWLNSLT